MHRGSRPRSGDRPPATLHDVAREAGVSGATASRVLNGSTRNVKQDNVFRVLAAAAKLNYAPHLSAQAVARGSTTTAAMVVSDIDDPYFSTIAAGVTEAAEAAGLIVTMAVSGRSPERELEIVRALRGQRPRAIIVAGSRIEGDRSQRALAEELLAYQTAGGRVVVISQPGLPFSTVSIDNFGGARQLARTLVQYGYRKFAIIHARRELLTSRDRQDGFEKGLRDAGVGDPVRIETEFTRNGGYRAAGELARRGVEAVFAVNDVMAIGAMTALRELGLVPGEDIAVAGFDDIASAVDVAPALTSVVIPLRKVGRTAMRLALRGDTEKVVTITTEVVVRESTPGT
ncbi:LacI family DNA-binding transcriptional regulator [Allorhizocola rhizosphaerae]|uniref:LacI family DNA-binding transcriptional regulator n=1 Tax=Allorhizocola rhizosphaerae TaxID=1872709 RepID=UPI000E3E5ED2|nr:LacI family DNA-binding transcriptional regulator [Allorhizocola rhizosphaerae]